MTTTKPRLSLAVLSKCIPVAAMETTVRERKCVQCEGILLKRLVYTGEKLLMHSHRKDWWENVLRSSRQGEVFQLLLITLLIFSYFGKLWRDTAMPLQLLRHSPERPLSIRCAQQSRPESPNADWRLEEAYRLLQGGHMCIDTLGQA